MAKDIAFARIFFILFALLCGVGTLWIPTTIIENADIYSDILSVISILSGVLIVVISILGSIPENLNAQALVLHDRSTTPKIMRLIFVFYLYLAVIVLVLASQLLKATDTGYHLTFQRASLFFGSIAIISSFGLPIWLSQAFRHTARFRA